MTRYWYFTDAEGVVREAQYTPRDAEIQDHPGLTKHEATEETYARISRDRVRRLPGGGQVFVFRVKNGQLVETPEAELDTRPVFRLEHSQDRKQWLRFRGGDLHLDVGDEMYVRFVALTETEASRQFRLKFGSRADGRARNIKVTFDAQGVSQPLRISTRVPRDDIVEGTVCHRFEQPYRVCIHAIDELD